MSNRTAPHKQAPRTVPDSMATLRTEAYHGAGMIPTGWQRITSVAAYALVWGTALGRADALPAQMPAPIFEVQRISLEGRWGPAPPGSDATALTLGYKAKIYELQLVRLRVLNGSVLYSRILANVQPYRPNFLLRGPDAEMHKLAGLRSGERVEITGWIHAGGREMLVSSIRMKPGVHTPPAQ